MRLCGSDLAAGGICFTPLNLSTGECRTADAHTVTERLTLVAPLTEAPHETPIPALTLAQA